MIKKIRQYLHNQKHYPILVGLLSGLLALLHLLNNNLTLFNTSSQLLYLITYFLLVPIVITCVLFVFIKKAFPNHKAQFLFISLGCFSAYYLSVAVYLVPRWKWLVIAFIAVICASFFIKHIYKFLTVIIAITCIMVAVSLSFTLYNSINQSSYSWTNGEEFSQVPFKVKPNIYLIQTDGYASPSVLKNEHYRFDNSAFYSYLKTKGFEIYPNFKSNYYTTLSSNASLFTGSHHYYGKETGLNELAGAREKITHDNAVLRGLKQNGYELNLVLNIEYLLLHRKDLIYDRSNISIDDIPFISNGYFINKELLPDLDSLRNLATPGQPQFYFLEYMEPGHVEPSKSQSKGIKKEREQYLEDLKTTNIWIKKCINNIEKHDPNALIIFAADHGGYVGFAYTNQADEFVPNVSLRQSIFGSLLAIKSPDNAFKSQSYPIRSSVNVFRYLFAYLANDTSILETKQSDASYIKLTRGEHIGVFKYLNEDGNSIFQAIE